MPSSPEPSGSSPRHSLDSQSAPLSANGHLRDPLESLPALQSPPPPSTHADDTTDHHSLAQQLDAVNSEKAVLEGQYRALLGKLTTMRNTLGDKLRQDADELDRREQQIRLLHGQTEDLNLTVDALKTELITAHEDAEAAHNEIESFRTRALDSQRANADEYTEREEALREAREELEGLRGDAEEWRREVMAESVRREEAEAALAQAQAALTTAQEEALLFREDRDREAKSASNLQAVLEEFQSAKDEELRVMVSDTHNQLRLLQKELATYKQRASLAEAKLASTTAESEQRLSLEKEVKEKNILIGKLRHEGVIINEHLTEALRRLKKDTNEYSVDRRLVTNVLLSFITTPRGDPKRFEMLSLLASVLSWSDDQREKVGLQKGSTTPAASGSKTPNSTSGAPRSGHRRGHTRSSAKGATLDDTLGENETFSALFIEFLLREAGSTASSVGVPLQSATAKAFQLPDIPATPPSPGSTLSLRSESAVMGNGEARS